jgi:hypothetical protein
MKAKNDVNLPQNFTGILEWCDGGKSFKAINEVVHYENGLCHREDGPAIIFQNGNKCWYLNGKSYTFEEKWNLKVDALRKSNRTKTNE